LTWAFSAGSFFTGRGGSTPPPFRPLPHLAGAALQHFNFGFGLEFERKESEMEGTTRMDNPDSTLVCSAQALPIQRCPIQPG
jgi:hypothetical protein